MRYDKNPRKQSLRTETNKQDRINTVRTLPAQPTEGYAVVLVCEDGSRCLAIFSESKWRYVQAQDTLPSSG